MESELNKAKSGATKVFKPFIVKRTNGQCQVLFPLSELDTIIDQILDLQGENWKIAIIKEGILPNFIFSSNLTPIRLCMCEEDMGVDAYNGERIHSYECHTGNAVIDTLLNLNFKQVIWEGGKDVDKPKKAKGAD